MQLSTEPDRSGTIDPDRSITMRINRFHKYTYPRYSFIAVLLHDLRIFSKASIDLRSFKSQLSPRTCNTFSKKDIFFSKL